MTYPGVPMCASTQSASTRTSERLMVRFLLVRPVLVGRPNPLYEQVHVAAETEVEGRVQERGGQRERGEDDPEDRQAGREAERADRGEYHADALGEARRRLRLGLGRR